MSFSDWTFSSDNGNPFVTTALYNNSLTNPLPQPYAGEFARFLPKFAGNGGGYMMVSPSAASGSLYNVPITKALRIQGCLRYTVTSEDPNVPIQSSGIGLTIKNSGNNMGSGYKLALGFDYRPNPDIHTINLVLPAWDPTLVSQGFIEYNGLGFKPLLAFNYLLNWISLRMDVTPIGTAGDRIVCYFETTASGSGVSQPGSGLWTQLVDHFVQSSSNTYIPWGNNNRQGVANAGMAGNLCVDKLNVYSFNIPE